MSNRYYQPSRTPSPVVESPHSTNRRTRNASTSSSNSDKSATHHQQRARAYSTIGKASLLIGAVAVVAGVLHIRKAKKEKELDRSERAERSGRRDVRDAQRRGKEDFERWAERGKRRAIEYPNSERGGGGGISDNTADSMAAQTESGRRGHSTRGPHIEFGQHQSYRHHDAGEMMNDEERYSDRVSDHANGRGRSVKR